MRFALPREGGKLTKLRQVIRFECARPGQSTRRRNEGQRVQARRVTTSHVSCLGYQRARDTERCDGVPSRIRGGFRGMMQTWASPLRD
jgi:hypothetical protein